MILATGGQPLGPARLCFPADVQHLQELQHFDEQRANENHQNVLGGFEEREGSASLVLRGHRRTTGTWIGSYQDVYHSKHQSNFGKVIIFASLIQISKDRLQTFKQ